MFTVTQLGKSFGAQVLFREASLQLDPGNRYGVVGANGSGKSTLVRILAGQEEASEGEVSMPRKARLGVLSQDHFQYEDTPILDVVMMGVPELWEAMQAKEELLARAEAEGFDADRYSALEDVVLRYDGYTLESRAGEILEGLNIPTELHRRPLSVLSGGFKLRVLLAQILAAEPDALLLDEPTNHLDILSVRWLEKYLEEFRGCVVLVSHDHRFLDNVCTHIIDIDYEQATPYRGNYTSFVKSKKADRDRMEAEIEKREKEIADHKKFIRRFKAKPTKARQAQSKLKRVEKIVIPSLPQSSRRHPKFGFKSCRPSGKVVVRVEDLEKSFDTKQVLKSVTWEAARGDRLAIIGPNGIGKSTLLKILVGNLEADHGNVEWGFETHPGYFAQDHRELLEGSKDTALSWLWDFVPAAPIGFVLGRLARVLFSREDTEKKVSNLSGGEAARLIFSRLSVTEPNVLILDEPTNHLDLEGIEALAGALEAYDGTILFVSHDRWFVSRLASRIIELTPDGLVDFRGTYEEYIAHCGDDHLDVGTVVEQAKQQKRQAKRDKQGKKATEKRPAEKKAAEKKATSEKPASDRAARRRRRRKKKRAEQKPDPKPQPTVLRRPKTKKNRKE